MATPTARRPPGRPSLGHQRREQVLDAFINLVGELGLESVTLDQVAQAAGVQRAVVRHFVGNRRDLVHEAIKRISELYQREVLAALGAEPRLDEMLTMLFGEVWVVGLTSYDRAFDALMLEASRLPEAATAIRQTYDLLMDELAAAIVRSVPFCDEVEARDAAYVITCLAEHNATMIQLGYPAARSQACELAARRLVGGLVPR